MSIDSSLLGVPPRTLADNSSIKGIAVKMIFSREKLRRARAWIFSRTPPFGLRRPGNFRSGVPDISSRATLAHQHPRRPFLDSRERIDVVPAAISIEDASERLRQPIPSLITITRTIAAAKSGGIFRASFHHFDISLRNLADG